MRTHFAEHNIYFVTNRCLQERLFFSPRRGINNLIGSWLARALKLYGDGIELYGFIFLSNHFHLLLRDTKGQLAEFMWYFQLNVGKSISETLGRKGYFFSREYDAAAVLTQDDFENRYAYILTNAVKAGLVDKAKDAPFFSSLQSALENKTLAFAWLDRTRKHNKSRRGQKVKREEFEETNPIALTVPPMWKNLTSKERKKRIEDLVKANEKRYGRLRRAEGKTVLGRAKILSQSPLSRPKNPAHSPRVKVFCQIKAQAEEYLASVRMTVGLYRDVYASFVNGAKTKRTGKLEWPPGCYPPSAMKPILPATLTENL